MKNCRSTKKMVNVSLQIFCMLFLLYSVNHTQVVRMSTDVILDKIKGGWFGKAYGVTYGGPTEFTSLGKIIEDSIYLTTKGLSRLHDQDDLYVNMAFLSVIAREGLKVSTDLMAHEFANARFLLWHANGQSRQNLLEGIDPSKAGHPAFNPHADDIDFQIEADFIGLISPGLPQAAYAISDRVGHIMNYGDGFYGGVFVSTMYTAAFIENDIQSVIEKGLRMLPPKSRYAMIVNDVIRWHREYPDDWRMTWAKIEEKWNKDLCPWSVKSKFNIGAYINGAYVVLALLYGEGDFQKTVEIGTRCGQDSDCNPSTAAGILGTMQGYTHLPHEVKMPFDSLMKKPFSFTSYSIESASESCLRLALQNIQNNNGSVLGNTVEISQQQYFNDRPAEVSFPSLRATDKFEVKDARLRWVGSWTLHDDAEEPVMTSSTKGDYLEVTFVGTSIYVQGDIHANLGILQYDIDGKKYGERDMYLDKKWRNAKQSKAVWITGLTSGTHVLRITVTGKKNNKSEGEAISLSRIVTYDGDIAKLN